MGSINSAIGANVAIDFGALAKLANGKYNKGEIVGELGRNGSFAFKKINNHVGFYHDRNNVRTSEEQNRVTNLAVFKAILTRYGGMANRGNEYIPDDGQMTIDDILNHDISTAEGRTQVEEALNSFGPYVKEAFKYLLTDGNDTRPLSRDELHRLLELLDGQDVDKTVAKNMGDLAKLRQFKQYGEGESQDVLNLVKGLRVRNISNTERARVLTASGNHGAYDFDLSELEAVARVVPRSDPAASRLKSVFQLVANMDQLREMVWDDGVTAADMNMYVAEKAGTTTHVDNALNRDDRTCKRYILDTVVGYVRQVSEAAAHISNEGRTSAAKRDEAVRGFLVAHDGTCVERRLANLVSWLHPAADDGKEIVETIDKLYDELVSGDNPQNGESDEVLCRKFREKLSEMLVGKKRWLVYVEPPQQDGGKWTVRMAVSQTDGQPLLQTVTEAYVREQADLLYRYCKEEVAYEPDLVTDQRDAVNDERVVPPTGGKYDYANEMRTLAGTLLGKDDATLVDDVRNALGKSALLPAGEFDLNGAVERELRKLRETANYGADYGQFIDLEFRDALTNRERLVRLIAGRISVDSHPRSELVRANVSVSALKLARYINNEATLRERFNGGNLSVEDLADKIANAVYSASMNEDNQTLREFLDAHVHANGTLKCVPKETVIVTSDDTKAVVGMMTALDKLEVYANPTHRIPDVSGMRNGNSVEFEEGLRPVPDEDARPLNAKGVKIAVRNAYPQGVGDEVIKSAQDIYKRARLNDDKVRDFNEALVRSKGKPTLSDAFTAFWNSVTDRFAHALHSAAFAGSVEGREKRLNLVDDMARSIYRKVLNAVLDSYVNDSTYEMIRSSICHVFTDAAAEFIGPPDYSRTDASDLIMAFWSMTDQALSVLMDVFPESEKTPRQEIVEKNFFLDREMALAADRKEGELREEFRVRELRTRPDVGTWPQDGDCMFLVANSTYEDQRSSVSPFKAKLLLGSKDNVQDVRVKNGVLMFKPADGDESVDWSLFFGKDWSQVPKQTEAFFAEFSRLADDPGDEEEDLAYLLGDSDEKYVQTKSSMPGTSDALADKVERLSGFLGNLMDEAGDSGTARTKQFHPAINDVLREYRDKVAAASPDELEDVRNPKTLKSMVDEKLVSLMEGLDEKSKARDLLLGAKILLDHALDRIADDWPNSRKSESVEAEPVKTEPVKTEPNKVRPMRPDFDLTEESDEEEDDEDDDDGRPLDNE